MILDALLRKASLRKTGPAICGCFVLAIMLSACGRTKTDHFDKSACWNPKILRAEIGDVVFDFPKSISVHSKQYKSPVGLINISHESVSSDKDNRIDCQKKDYVPIHLGDVAGYRFSSHEKGLSPIFGEIKRYVPGSKDLRFSLYLTDISNASSVRLSKSYSTRHNKGREVERRLIFEFSGKRAETTCQVWGVQDASEKNWLPGTTYPYSCVPGIPFRMGNMIVTVRDPSVAKASREGANGPGRPEHWPALWQDSLNKISSYRAKLSGV